MYHQTFQSLFPFVEYFYSAKMGFSIQSYAVYSLITCAVFLSFATLCVFQHLLFWFVQHLKYFVMNLHSPKATSGQLVSWHTFCCQASRLSEERTTKKQDRTSFLSATDSNTCTKSYLKKQLDSSCSFSKDLPGKLNLQILHLNSFEKKEILFLKMEEEVV